MRVTLAAHGGWAAPIKLGRPGHAVDSVALPPDQDEELRRLVDAAIRAQPAGAATGGARARDAMSYTITIDQDDATTVLKGSDTDASPAFADLLAWLESHTR